MVNVSLFASAVRPELWPALFRSLEGTTIEYELIFSGNTNPIHWRIFQEEDWRFTYKYTGNIKPAQCYEIARRKCQGEVIVWIADDCEFPNDIIGKSYEYWKMRNNQKLILSIQTKESGYGSKEPILFPMKEHTFFSQMSETPLMAPIGMMSREYLNKLGGIDKRYVCGQYENDIVMRAYADGAKVEVFGNEDNYVEIDHLKKSIDIGESKDDKSFLDRPFAKGYGKDREILEKSWTTFCPTDAFKRLQAGERPFSLRRISPIQLDEFQPYPENISLTESESNKGIWE